MALRNFRLVRCAEMVLCMVRCAMHTQAAAGSGCMAFRAELCSLGLAQAPLSNNRWSTHTCTAWQAADTKRLDTLVLNICTLHCTEDCCNPCICCRLLALSG